MQRRLRYEVTEAVLQCNGGSVAWQFSSRYMITAAPLGCNRAAVAKWRKGRFLLFGLNVW
jgi:hypothetical protein